MVSHRTGKRRLTPASIITLLSRSAYVSSMKSSGPMTLPLESKVKGDKKEASGACQESVGQTMNDHRAGTASAMRARRRSGHLCGPSTAIARNQLQRHYRWRPSLRNGIFLQRGNDLTLCVGSRASVVCSPRPSFLGVSCHYPLPGRPYSAKRSSVEPNSSASCRAAPRTDRQHQPLA